MITIQHQDTDAEGQPIGPVLTVEIPADVLGGPVEERDAYVAAQLAALRAAPPAQE